MRSRPLDPAGRAVQRLRLACVCAALTLLVFSQSSGKEAADTKLDLVVTPGRFLRDALRMWDPQAAAGQMQNQAYGYLFPMGPFFLLAKWAHLSPWVAQRAWESLLVVVAFLGVVRLARLLGVRGLTPRIAAGLAYALAPRVLMEVTAISSELLPAVVLPWVLIPLVGGSRAGSARRAAARSGVALLFAGGINAAATVAILPVPALWLLTRSPGPRRRALMGWWVVAVAAASAWWVVPLLVLGRYSPPFLDWIESSAVTTSQTGLVATLRGAEHWQAYLGPSVWPGGWILVAAPAAILATTAVAAIGLAGLSGRQVPHRSFLICSLLLGLVLVTLGHVAPAGPPFAGAVRDLLDGPLNAFRNVHKFDPVVRLPLAIGVGHGVGALLARWPRRLSLPRLGDAFAYGRPVLAVALAGIAAVAVSPALAGRLVPSSRSVNEPGWWTRTGAWLGEHDGRGRALVVPGAGQPVYLWGAPHDDALQPVAGGPWTVRDGVPLAQAGYVRLLDSIESMLATGADQPSLAPLLARAGIKYLVVRNDLDTAASGATAVRFVHATLAASDGFTHAAGFGAGPPRPNPDRLLDRGLIRSTAAVDVYRNAAWTDEVALLPAGATVLANGAADELTDLVAAGLPATTPVIFGPSPPNPAGAARRAVVTDGLRRREFGFGGINRYSATLARDDRFSTDRKVHDYLPAGSGPLTVADYSGIRTVSASSSASDTGSYLYRGAAYSPWAALDADTGSAWFSAAADGAVGQWLRITLAAPLDAPSIRLAFAARQGTYPSRLRVTTDAGTLVTDVVPASTAQDVPLPPGRTRAVKLAVVAATGGGQVGIASLRVPGLFPTRTLRVRTGGTPDALLFRATAGYRAACIGVATAPACDADWTARGEEDDALSRTFDLASAEAYSVRATVRLRPGRGLDALLDGANPVRAIASSRQAADPRVRPGSAVDGTAATGWVAAPGDRSPSLTLSLPSERELTGLVLAPFPRAPVARATRVTVHAGAEPFSTAVPPSGRITFPAPARTASLTVTVDRGTVRVSTDAETGQPQLLPVGIGEITLLGAAGPAGEAPAAVGLGCDSGLAMTVDGRSVPLRVDASAHDVLAGREVTAVPCDAAPAELGRGAHTVRLAAYGFVAPVSLALNRLGSAPLSEAGPSAGPIRVREWTATDRRVRVDAPAAAFLVVRENANAGWRATLHGTTLRPVTLDGWQQGWVLPAGSQGTVTLTYVPQTAVELGLLGGLFAALSLLLAAALRGRPARAPALGDRRASGAVLVAITAVGLVALGAWWGAAVAVVVVVARRLVGASPLQPPPWSGALALGGAGLLVALRPPGSAEPVAGSLGVQLLGLLAVALSLIPLTPSAAPRPGKAAQQRPLEQVPRRGRRRRGRQRGEDVETEEVAVEIRPAQPPLYGDQ